MALEPPTVEESLRSRKRRYAREGDSDTEPTAIVLSEAEAQPLLQSGEIIGGHRIQWGSNYTFLAFPKATIRQRGRLGHRADRHRAL